ncbi:ran binding protein, putative [Ricinus communis]|uniref:Ran binding protein, putative n=1 Tax=Ricinus communis TaxID=3988 RepID=B9SWY4_RICCO|nr:ran binding protein, putative [Ricinus communis]|eukprot:XP_002530503.1 ran-binding protein 1 homolog a [Ricinus communis]
MASTAATSDPEHTSNKEREEEENAPDEDTGAQVAPIVKLEEVAVSTGEEDEDSILDLKAKLYRFDKEGNQWKERGVGNVKLLKHKESGKSIILISAFLMLLHLLDCKTFMETVQEVSETQGKKEERKEAEDAAGLLEKLSVGDSKTEEKEKEEVPVESKEAEGEKTKAEAGKDDQPASSA